MILTPLIRCRSGTLPARPGTVDRSPEAVSDGFHGVDDDAVRCHAETGSDDVFDVIAGGVPVDQLDVGTPQAIDGIRAVDDGEALMSAAHPSRKSLTSDLLVSTLALHQGPGGLLRVGLFRLATFRDHAGDDGDRLGHAV